MRNLLALLITREAGDLEHITERWSIELPRAGRAERAAVLSREMVRDSSAHRLWDALPADARDLLMTFARAPERQFSELGIPRDSPALRATFDAGLLWAFEESEREGGIPSLSLPPIGDPTLILPPELCRLLGRLRADIEQGDTSTLPLDQLLESMGTGEMENLAAYWGLAAEPGSYTREELLESLLGRISGSSTERVVREAPEAARKLYEALMRAGGRARTAELGVQVGLSPPELRDSVADLAERLLALEVYNDGWELYTPQGPQHALPGEPRGGSLVPVPSPQRHVQGPRWAPAWDLINLLRSLELYDVPEEQGELPEAFVSRFESALTTRPAAPPDNLRFLYHSAHALGLVRVEGSACRPTPRTRSWAEQRLELQARRVLEYWVEHGARNEAVPLIGSAGYREDREVEREARRTVLAQLALCQPDEWFSVESLVASVRAHDQFLLRPQNRLVRDLGSAGARRAMENWDKVEGEWVRRLIGGVLGWLHVVEVVAGPEAAFALTPDGAWLVGRVPRPPLDTSPPRISVSEEGRVRVSSPDGKLLWTLAGFARPTRTNGRPSYLIDRRSIARARGTGQTPSAVTATLRRHTQNSVPPALAGRIQEWGREPHRIRMRPTLLVECETEQGAEELLASPIVRTHSPRKVDATRVLLSLPHENMDEELRTLMRRLTRSGLFSDEPTRR